MKSGGVRFLIVAMAGFAVGGVLALLVVTPQQEQIRPPSQAAAKSSQPVAGVEVGGAFSLVDHTGAAVTEKSWPGKFRLVFFGFTHCPDICPAALDKIATLMAAVDAQGERLVPLFITVDPARDTPAVMAAYIAPFDPHIVGLTGTQQQVQAAISAYKVFAAQRPAEGAGTGAPAAAAGHDGHDSPGTHQDHGAQGGPGAAGHDDYMVDHSAYFYLMSPDGKLLEISASDDSVESLVAKIKLHIH